MYIKVIHGADKRRPKNTSAKTKNQTIGTISVIQ